MDKEDLRKCIICGNTFNAYYKHEGSKKTVCSQVCYRKYRRDYDINWRKKKRKEWRSKNLCGACGGKVKPITRIPYRCKCCEDKIREYRKGRSNEQRTIL